jgi:hypothetical protein
MSEWIIGGFMAFLAILGLFLAAGAYDTGMYTFGLLLFGFGLLFDFWLVKKHFDTEERGTAVPPASEVAD